VLLTCVCDTRFEIAQDLVMKGSITSRRWLWRISLQVCNCPSYWTVLHTFLTYYTVTYVIASEILRTGTSGKPSHPDGFRILGLFRQLPHRRMTPVALCQNVGQGHRNADTPAGCSRFTSISSSQTNLNRISRVENFLNRISTVENFLNRISTVETNLVKHQIERVENFLNRISTVETNLVKHQIENVLTGLTFCHLYQVWNSHTIMCHY
jgi:hypothetical protein